MSNDRTGRGFFDLVERVGNRLPDPAVLFVLGAALVMVLSQVGVWLDWEVQPVRPTRIADAATGEAGVELVPEGEIIRPVSLLTSSGLYWAISSMVPNFVDFPPLGVIVVCMLGVGVAERSGLIGVLLRWMMLGLPRAALTPMVVFIGVNASLAADAGIIILPPLAAAMYKAAGRSPLAGIAAAYAGVSGGFSANLLVTSLDPLLARLTEDAARVVDPGYSVLATCNWWFMIASTFLLTGMGWLVTARVIEPRLAAKPEEEGGISAGSGGEGGEGVSSVEARGLKAAGLGLAGVLGLAAACAMVPGWPLHGFVDAAAVRPEPRWVAGLVPALFFAFLIPGLAYGVCTRSIRGSGDAARMMGEALASMAPVLVMCFFAAQFLEYFKYSNLGKMLAMVGGKALAASGLGPGPMMVAFVLVIMLFNLLVTSASAKWAVFASIFVPMFMMVGISPELTQAAFRVGDSTTNIIAPLNAYIVIVLAVMQRFAPKAGLGTLMSLMLPYSVAFGLAWIVLLLVWMWTGRELGIGGPLTYTPP